MGRGGGRWGWIGWGKDGVGFGGCGGVVMLYYELGVSGRYFDGE